MPKTHTRSERLKRRDLFEKPRGPRQMKWIRNEQPGFLTKYEGKCSMCGDKIHIGDRIVWHKISRRVSHVACVNEPAIVCRYEPNS